MLTFPAPAKLNLYLHLTGKRADGYHLLDSLIVFLDIGDRLIFEPADTLSLHVTGPIHVAADEENLVMKAARLLAAHSNCQRGAKITLEKQLPLGGGLGGGSADAAATLKGLCTLWQLPLTEQELLPLALHLGADVPACLSGKAAYMGGIGEILEPVANVPALPVVLIHPRIALSTPEVFRQGGHPFHPGPVRAQGDWLAFLRAQTNALQPAATALIPVISTLIEMLNRQPGCQLARMSGSGATCFGLFSDHAAAEQAVAMIAKERPEWWVAKGVVR